MEPASLRRLCRRVAALPPVNRDDAPPDLHGRARGAAGEPSAGSSTPRCGRTSTSGRTPGTSPTIVVPPLRRARLPRPPLPGALGRQRRRPRRGPRVRRGAGPLRRRRDPDGDLGADRTWPRPRSREFGTDDQRERWLRPAIAGDEDRRDRDHRARRRLRRRRDPHPRRARRRRVAHQRPQDVHHQRHARALPHARRQDRSRARATTASRCSSSTRRCPACACRAGSRSSACTRRDTAEIALDDVRGARTPTSSGSNRARVSRS